MLMLMLETVYLAQIEAEFPVADPRRLMYV